MRPPDELAIVVVVEVPAPLLAGADVVVVVVDPEAGASGRAFALDGLEEPTVR